MKTLVFFALATLFGVTHATYPLITQTLPGPYAYTFEVPCSNLITKEIVTDFRKALYDIDVALLRKIAELSEGHFSFSPLTVWKTLAAISEGSEGQTREGLYRFLTLPEDKCARQSYYQLASTREAFSHDVVLDRNQLFIADSGVALNTNWVNYVRSQKLIDVAQTPYKSNREAAIESWKQIFNAQLPSINLNGNSLILESLDYSGLWTSAFSDVTVVKEPFFDASGEALANIEYMKTKRRVSMAYIPSLNMKILRLPVGKGGRYTMVFAIFMGDSQFERKLDVIETSVVYEALTNFKKSRVPIEVVIPRVTMSSETDLRKVLEDIGVTGMWADPYATRNISEPAALPSSYIQRVTVTLDNSGNRPAIQEYSNFIPPIPSDASPYPTNSTGLDPALGQDFIANRPFLFGLFDTELFTCLFASSFSKPSYLK